MHGAERFTEVTSLLLQYSRNCIQAFGLIFIGVFGSLTLITLLSVTLSSEAFATGGSVEGQAVLVEPEDEDPIEQGVNPILFHFVNDGLRVSSYSNIDWKLPSMTLQEVLDDHNPEHLNTIIFRSAKAFRRLDSSLTSQIQNRFEEGSLILGIDGTHAELDAQFDVLEDDRPGDSERDMDHWVLLRRAPDGHLNELMLTADEVRRHRRRAMSAISNWKVARTKNDLAQTSKRATRGPAVSPGWKRISQVTLRPGHGSLKVYGTKLGSGQYIFDVYYAGSSDQGLDYYLIETNVVGTTDSYSMTGNHFGDTSGECGFWVDELGVGLSLNTPNAVIESYMPDSTVSSTSSSQSIGASIGPSISTSAVGVSGSISTSVSRSFSTSDATISAHVEYDEASPSIRWKADLTGCRDFEWYPDYSGASNVAKDSYSLWASAIIEVPKGQQLKFRTRAPDVAASSSPMGTTYLQLSKVHMWLYWLVTVQSSTETWFWNYDLDVTCNNYSCTHKSH